jgi:HD-GYP domain-containing protein (c-di-GMP phosphodiesterase class II)
MTIDQPNRPAKSKEEAIAELRKEAETQFSPEAVEVLADIVIKEKKSPQEE